jgi:DNA invertase Pin-like site-specific DNA recombinase
MVRNYSENLREEVKRRMCEKASQGTYPGHAPFGYRNNTGTRTIDIHLENGPIAKHVFEMYASGRYSLLGLSKELRHVQGTHASLITPELYAQAQSVLWGHN